MKEKNPTTNNQTPEKHQMTNFAEQEKERFELWDTEAEQSLGLEVMTPLRAEERNGELRKMKASERWIPYFGGQG